MRGDARLFVKSPAKAFITLMIILLSINTSILFSCDRSAERYLFDLDKMQLEALEYLNKNYDSDYTGCGYYTIMIDENYKLVSVIITYLFVLGDKINSVYEVSFDINGVIKGGSSIYNVNSYYELYKNESGIFVVKGIYGSYLLMDNDTLVYTGNMDIDKLVSNDKIDSNIFNSEFIRKEYGIDISKLYNNIITKMN